jgi:hypothetical protein
MITAIDPGTTESAILTLDGGVVTNAQIVPNDDLLQIVRLSPRQAYAVEMIACYGMPVGREVFETCLVIGRLQEIIQTGGGACRLVYRRDVKMWLCGTARAKDPNITQALKDKYGEPGTKKNPGKIYGVKSHLWAALAVADYALGNPI